jgi:hypothetical protein
MEEGDLRGAAPRPSRSLRRGHEGAIGPKPIGATWSLRCEIISPGGVRLGMGTAP